ncbi:hypothetical protein [Methylocystis sp. B8]|uniref:hypothetical protein n=1 Tax=Methylocystis sp. B8 TaxID=544938 RepID=UPI0010FF5D53|nr:hypothetical protein [Methylocystis sp. B8]TLG79070.1 hypothetical protein FEV16_03345 [Methylocystis sp. B8]
MDAKDYRAEAALFFCKATNANYRSLSFRRFARASEAIRFAVEELVPRALASCSLEVDQQHFFGREIRSLYDSPDYPLRRRPAKFYMRRV